jgi:hypothetical protein
MSWKSYPQYLHENHNDLPLLLEDKIPPGLKVKKLMATLKKNNNYIWINMTMYKG